jgi:anti-anti-sigma regulatory factor
LTLLPWVFCCLHVIAAICNSVGIVLKNPTGHVKQMLKVSKFHEMFDIIEKNADESNSTKKESRKGDAKED